MLYATRDGNGERVLWTGKPELQLDGTWDLPATRNGTFISETDADIVRAIFPKGLRPGDCVKVGRLSVVRRIEKEKRNVMGE